MPAPIDPQPALDRLAEGQDRVVDIAFTGFGLIPRNADELTRLRRDAREIAAWAEDVASIADTLEPTDLSTPTPPSGG